LIQSDEAEQDAWGIEREPVQQNEDAAPMSIRQRIRLMGKAALAQKAKVVAAPPPKASIKGLKRHIHYEYYEHLRNINKQTCFNALLSLVLAVTSNEIHWSQTKVIEPSSPSQGPITEPALFNTLTEVIKCVVTANVLLVVLGIFRYYSALLALEKLRGSMLPQDTFYSAGYLPQWLLETCIVFIHPIPFTYWIWVKEERGGVITHYGSDDIFTVLMLPRIYLVFRVFRDSYGMNSERSRYVGSLCRVDLDGAFITFKALMQDQPITMVPMLYLFVMMVLSYSICVFERPLDAQFQDIRNGLWVIFVIMTTVGYGDLFPSTDLGRTVAVFACGAALLILMLLIIGMSSVMAPDAKEYKVFHILKYKRWKSKMQVQGATVIQSFWRCARMLDRPDQPLVWQTSYVADTKLCFDVRAFRRLRAEEPMEQRDVGTMLFEIGNTVRSIGDKIDTVQETLDNAPGQPTGARI